jgi:hypothetical protein
MRALLLIALVVFAGLALIALLRPKPRLKQTRNSPRAAQPAAPAETALRVRQAALQGGERLVYEALREALGPRWVALTRQPLSAAIEPQPDHPDRLMLKRRLGEERVDFLVCDAVSMAPCLAVDLVRQEDDRDSAWKLAALASGGLRLLSLRLSDLDDPAELRERFAVALSKQALPRG